VFTSVTGDAYRLYRLKRGQYLPAYGVRCTIQPSCDPVDLLLLDIDPQIEDLVTLGAEGILPGGYIESLLRVFKQFTHILPTFYPVGNQWANSQCTHQFDLDGISG